MARRSLRRPDRVGPRCGTRFFRPESSCPRSTPPEPGATDDVGVDRDVPPEGRPDAEAEDLAVLVCLVLATRGRGIFPDADARFVAAKPFGPRPTDSSRRRCAGRGIWLSRSDFGVRAACRRFAEAAGEVALYPGSRQQAGAVRREARWHATAASCLTKSGSKRSAQGAPAPKRPASKTKRPWVRWGNTIARIMIRTRGMAGSVGMQSRDGHSREKGASARGICRSLSLKRRGPS
jgi:hypothetical protein